MLSTAALSVGCLEAIMNGNDCDKPVLQILGAKKITSCEGTERYRVFVSDGRHINSFALLGTELSQQYDEGKFSEFTIVRVDSYITPNAKNSKKENIPLLILLELTVLNHGSEVGKKIGNPVTYTPDSSKLTTTTTSNNNQQASSPIKPLLCQ